MKLTVLIPIWKRHDLTAIVFENLSRQQAKFGFNVVIVGSEGEASKELTEKFGFAYLEYSNEFLGAKLNAGLARCKGNVVVIGSDDFLSDNAFEYYLSIDEYKKEYHGVRSVYFYSTKAKQSSRFDYKGINFKTIGAGRIYTRSLIDACNGELWENDKNIALDTSAAGVCRLNGGKEILTDKFYVLDVKHSHNLTNPDIYRIGKSADSAEIKKVFGDFVYESISVLPAVCDTVRRLKRSLNTKIMVSTVKIKLLTDIGAKPAGTELEQPKQRASKLVLAGKAEYVVAEEKSKTNDNGKTGNEPAAKTSGDKAGAKTDTGKKGKGK